jgi:hypothetical protein
LSQKLFICNILLLVEFIVHVLMHTNMFGVINKQFEFEFYSAPRAFEQGWIFIVPHLL